MVRDRLDFDDLGLRTLNISEQRPQLCDDFVACITGSSEKRFDAFNLFGLQPKATDRSTEIDARVGGRYRIGMQPPDREQPHTSAGEYRELREPNHIVRTSS